MRILAFDTATARRRAVATRRSAAGKRRASLSSRRRSRGPVRAPGARAASAGADHRAAGGSGRRAHGRSDRGRGRAGNIHWAADRDCDCPRARSRHGASARRRLHLAGTGAAPAAARPLRPRGPDADRRAARRVVRQPACRPGPIRARRAADRPQRAEAGAAGGAPDGARPGPISGAGCRGPLAVGDGAVKFRSVLQGAGVMVPDEGSRFIGSPRWPHCVLAADLRAGCAGCGAPEYLRLADAEIARRTAAQT